MWSSLDPTQLQEACIMLLYYVIMYRYVLLSPLQLTDGSTSSSRNMTQHVKAQTTTAFLKKCQFCRWSILDRYPSRNTNDPPSHSSHIAFVDVVLLAWNFAMWIQTEPKGKCNKVGTILNFTDSDRSNWPKNKWDDLKGSWLTHSIAHVAVHQETAAVF